MGNVPCAAPWPMLYPGCRTTSVTSITSRKPRSPSPRRTAMPRRSSKNTSVACAPWNGPWRVAPIPKPRSYAGTAAQSGVPSPMMADHLWRRPASNSTIASPPLLRAWSGWKKGGLAQGARAPADAPAAWAGRDGIAVARGACSLWLVHRAAHLLHNDTQEPGAAVQRRLHGLLGAMGQHQAKAGTLAPAVEHFLQVSRSYWPGLFHCYTVPDLLRTNNDLEQFFGAYRSHERRATGRKVASPAVVLRGAVRLVACAAICIRSFTSEELAPDTISVWQELRHALETRRHQRTQRRRFRQAPATYLGQLEAQLLQLILPP